MIARYLANTTVSPNKIYIAGFSVGAFFANQLAVKASDLIAAAFIDEGAFPQEVGTAPDPNAYGSPLAAISIINFKGQFGRFHFCGSSNPVPFNSFPSQDDEFKYWTTKNGCSTVPSPSTNFCTVPYGGEGSNLTNLQSKFGISCTNSTEVKYYQLFCGQHAWYDTDITTTPCTIPYPGLVNNTGPLGGPGFGPANSGVTTDSFVWNFFSTHPKASSSSRRITLFPTTLTFNGIVGGSNPANQSFTVTNTGGGTLSWSATKTQTWLMISFLTGGTGATVTCSINTTGLTAGLCTDTVTVSASGATNTPQLVSMTLNMTGSSPTISLSTNTLNFLGTAGGTNPPSNTFTVTNTGGGILSWTGTKTQPG